jgi:pyruvate dehydrogenase E2 component (dihydrolipoamide acetyltransferase)
MARLFLMPRIDADTTQVTLAAWCVKPGESFEAGSILAEIETDKATMDLPADDAGVMGEQLVSAGEEVEVGAPLCVVLAVGEASVNASALAPEEVPASANLRPDSNQRPTPVETSTEELTESNTGKALARAMRLFVSPVARNDARELAVDLSELTGRGPGGRIVRRDVIAAAKARKDAGVTQVAPLELARVPAMLSDAVVPHSRMRLTIARRLSISKATIPHFYLTGDLEVDALTDLRGKINEGRPAKISLSGFLVRAVAGALTSVPEANVSWADEGMIHHRHADIAVAVATEAGLITPIIRSAETKTLFTISAELADLIDRARAGRLEPTEYEGGSFTISNLGMMGVQSFLAIINPPQAAILAVGAVRKGPVVRGDAIVVGNLTQCTLSVDHRAIDGVVAARWFAAFAELVQDPTRALT